MKYDVTRHVVKCDKCEKEIENNEFYEIDLCLYYQDGNVGEVILKGDCCSECLEKTMNMLFGRE